MERKVTLEIPKPREWIALSLVGTKLYLKVKKRWSNVSLEIQERLPATEKRLKRGQPDSTRDLVDVLVIKYRYKTYKRVEKSGPEDGSTSGSN
jgi:hypothetical protein